MSGSKQARRSASQGESATSKNALIRRCLQTQLLTFPQKELFEEEIGNWERDLGPFPIVAIEQAFDNWRRCGRWFPVYGDIIDLCIAYQPPQPEARERIPAAQYGKGYNETDMLWLAQQISKKIETEKRTREQRLTDSEIDSLLGQLDAKRGHPPVWRTQRELP